MVHLSATWLPHPRHVIFVQQLCLCHVSHHAMPFQSTPGARWTSGSGRGFAPREATWALHSTAPSLTLWGHCAKLAGCATGHRLGARTAGRWDQTLGWKNKPHDDQIAGERSEIVQIFATEFTLDFCASYQFNPQKCVSTLNAPVLASIKDPSGIWISCGQHRHPSHQHDQCNEQ